MTADHVHWSRLETAWQNIEYVQGTIIDQVEGGFRVDLGGAAAFLPAGQVALPSNRDVPPLNVPQMFQILRMDRKQGTIVVSRRTVLEAIRCERLLQLAEGQVVEGVVDNIGDEGAFVDLGSGVVGLLPSSDVAWRRVNHPAEVLSIGQQVRVKIIKMDFDPEEGRRVWVGIKQLDDPWQGIEAKFPVGGHFRGRVTNIQKYGVFVELEPGVEGFLHASDMSWTGNVFSPEELASTGQEVDVQIRGVDAVKRRISLKTLEAESQVPPRS